MRREVPASIALLVVAVVLLAIGVAYWWATKPDKGMNEQAMRQELLERARKGQLPGVTPEVLQRLEAQAGGK
ncbi:MAG: hypothetical protein HPY54_08425 [Chthonomonadetes bacterium]|nr:hypothetical protein [Chthonomonadetes bacterium]